MKLLLRSKTCPGFGCNILNYVLLVNCRLYDMYKKLLAQIKVITAIKQIIVQTHGK